MVNQKVEEGKVEKEEEAKLRAKKNSEKNELRKNLNKLYEESKNDEIDYITVNKRQNIVNWKLKDSIKILKKTRRNKTRRKKGGKN